MYQIERGIPIPPEDWSPVGKALDRPIGFRAPGYCGTNYPWAALRRGESFLVPSHKKRRELLARIRAACKKYNKEFTPRVVEGGVRIWRTA